MSISVCVAGVTGWTGRSVAAAVLRSSQFRLAAALARGAAGRTVEDATGLDTGGGAAERVIVSGSVAQALRAKPDVWIDYTHPLAVKAHAVAALEAGTNVVIGTSGLSASDDRDLDAAARAAGRGVIVSGNFSLTASLLKHLASIAARHLPSREIVDYAGAGKPDAPTGTALELAEHLASIAPNQIERLVEDTAGHPDARGAALGGTQVHSVRLPGYVIAVEALFGLPGERLSIRHDAGNSAEPYVEGTLLAAERAGQITGLVRGLDTLLFG